MIYLHSWSWLHAARRKGLPAGYSGRAYTIMAKPRARLGEVGDGFCSALVPRGEAVELLDELVRLRRFGVEDADILARAHSTPLALALASSYAIWLLDFLSVWLLARSLGLPLPFIEVSLAMSVAYAATVLPVSVGGHGIREGALLAMLALLGLLPDDVSRQLALLLAVLVWATSVFWSLVGGAVLLLTRRSVPPSR